jgi:hypothetical protein
MTWDALDQPSTFEKARRKEAYRRFSRLVKRQGDSTLVPLDELQQRLRMFDQSYVGIRAIPVDAIVGSADRASDFDNRFLPKTSRTRERWKHLERSFPAGDFPPIVVYQVDESYFVVDGHHRVAIAKAKGLATIDAEVTRLKARLPIPRDLDMGELIRLEQQRLFLSESGLERARPEALIEFSRPPGYIELLELVRLHGYNLINERQELIPIEEIAADWYDRLYLPTVEAIKREGLLDAFPNTTEADQFLWIYQRWRHLYPEHGPVSLEDTVQTQSWGKKKRLKGKARRALSREGTRSPERQPGPQKG